MGLFSILCSTYLLFMGNNPTIDYRLSYLSDSVGDASSQIFSSVLNTSHVLATYNTSYECKNECANATECLGYVHYNNDDKWLTLDDLGEPLNTNVTSISFTKYTSYDVRDSHTIYGYFWYHVLSHGKGQQHTVYIDLNHNGLHDVNEPINTTVKNNFEFNNLKSGNYMIREKYTDSCIQLLPGAWGYNDVSYDNNNIGDYSDNNFVDDIVRYYHNGHTEDVTFDGGVIISSNTTSYTPFKNVNMSFILEDTPSTFISFKPNYGIIFAFINEVIKNGPGHDIVVNTFGNSSTNAYVSVSHNDEDYVTLGILPDTINSFDLSIVNYTSYVSFVKIDFFNNDANSDDTRNIISVKGMHSYRYFSVPYAAFITVPPAYDVIFVKDCEYYYSCTTYCFFSQSVGIDECLIGCELWEQTATCDCENADNVLPPFVENCVNGCTYNIQYDVYPEYLVKMNASGIPSQVTTSINCDKYNIDDLEPNGCMLNAIDLCTRQPSCNSLSLVNHTYANLYDDFKYVNNNNSYFLVKSDYNLSEFISTTTTTGTTTTTTPTTTTTTGTTTTTTGTTTTTTTGTTTTTTPTTTTTTPTTTTGTTTTTTTTSTTGTTTTTTTTSTTGTTTTNTTNTSTNATVIMKNYDIGKSSNIEITIYRGIIIGTGVILISVFIIICCYKVNTRREQIPHLNRDNVSYTNPIYGVLPVDTLELYNESQNDYLDVSPHNDNNDL